VNHPIIEFIFSQSEIIKPDFNISVPQVVPYEKGVSLKGKYISADEVYEMLVSFFENKKDHSNSPIFKSICYSLNFSESEIKGKSRIRKTIRKRHYVCYKMCSLGIGLSEIGRILGNKDHSGIIKGKDQVIEILKKSSKDYEYYLLIQEWEHTLSGLDRKDL